MMICLLIFFCAMADGLQAGGDNIGSSKDDLLHAATVKCRLSADRGRVRSGDYPVFTIQLDYHGTTPRTLDWDDNFGHVLWNGQIIMMVKGAGWERNTESLKYQTSATYPTRKQVTARKGMALASKLDFSAMPRIFSADLFPKTGAVEIGLYVKIETPKGPQYLPISNIVNLVIE